jgi:2-methylcitrate dehydratase PrpD
MLALRKRHQLQPGDIAQITIESFHEATRLAKSTPETTEEAQYSTSYPVAVAAVMGRLDASDIAGEALQNAEVLRLSKTLIMRENSEANMSFPLRRMARVWVQLHDGRRVESDWHEPIWEHTDPPAAAQLHAKFSAYAAPVIGADRAGAIRTAVLALDQTPAAALLNLLTQPI